VMRGAKKKIKHFNQLSSFVKLARRQIFEVPFFF
jgi:hypothetical protein